MLVRFKSLRVPQRYTDLAARLAVLYPLTGFPSDLKRNAFQAIGRNTLRVVAMWRRRVMELREANWALLAKRGMTDLCLNCFPSLMVMTPSTLLCKQRSICPFCYARSVQELVRSAVAVYKGIPEAQRGGYWMAGYVQTVYLPAEGKKPMSLPQMFALECKQRKRLYGTLQSFGGFAGTEFEPVDLDKWRLTRRGILLVPEGADVTRLSVDKIKLVKQYSGQRVAKLVGWAMRYPRDLIGKAFAPSVVQLLHNRKGHRLYASFGLFRSCKNE